MSECFATLITCTVDPALPDLLTRHGPLAFVHTLSRTEALIMHLGSMFCVVGDMSSQHTQYSISTAHSFANREGSYPVGHFGGNQLLGGSMSLSPLCCTLTNNLHVSNATGFHRVFPHASPCCSIDHHLSGLNICTMTVYGPWVSRLQMSQGSTHRVSFG